MKQTPMQDLISKFDELAKKEGDSGFVGRSVLSIIKNGKFLEKEKQVIEDAFIEALDSEICAKDSKILAEDYYNETFKQK